MTTVNQLLQSKGPNLWTVAPDTSVIDALKLMADKDVGALLVVNGDGDLIGIVSERDYARKVVLPERSPEATPVSEIMTDRVYYVRPEDSMNQCMALMTDQQVRHLPVLADGRLKGIVSMRDVVRVVISEQEFMIEQLENYIVGGG